MPLLWEGVGGRLECPCKKLGRRKCLVSLYINFKTFSNIPKEKKLPDQIDEKKRNSFIAFWKYIVVKYVYRTTPEIKAYFDYKAPEE